MDAILLSERISTLNSSPEIAKLTVKDPHKDLVADQLRVAMPRVDDGNDSPPTSNDFDINGKGKSLLR